MAYRQSAVLLLDASLPAVCKPGILEGQYARK